MRPFSPPRSRNEFPVGIICALSLEAEFVESVLDKCWENEGMRYGKAAGDQNVYTTGLIRGHNVVLAYMPGTGNSSAAAVAAGLRSSFPQVKLALVVGICGATPIHAITSEEIVLGDCIISTAVVQYDFGRQYPGGFLRKNSVEDSLGRASPEIRALTQKLTTPLNRKRVTRQLGNYLAALQSGAPKAKYPGVSRDRLYESSYIHGHKSPNDICDKCLKDMGTCSKDCDELKCDLDHLSTRERFDAKEALNSSEAPENFLPAIHFGRFGSANTVMKSGTDRDRIAKVDEIIAFEMEGAGVWDQVPTVVIKAVCDYADSHKSKEWQIYAAASAAACMKAFLDEWIIPDQGAEYNDFSVTFSLAPAHEIEHFVARKDELIDIHKILSGDCSRHTVVLHGLGGIGKTQLSVAYAKQHKDSYSAIFWLNIKDEDSLKQSFTKIARQIIREHPSALRLSNVDMNESLDEVVDAVKAWLSRPNNTQWLMIFDNYDNPKLSGNSDPTAVDIRNFFPESYQGSIIITTRSSQVNFGHYIEIRKLSDVHDSLEILSNFSRREELRSDPDAIILARELDGLPLALATAGAYLNQVAISFSDYLRLYKQSWAQLHKSSPDLDSYENRTLYSTWQISFDHVTEQNALSAKLLCFWAYFDSQDLWLELLQHSDSNDPEWVRELTKDELSFHQAVRVLSNHGLVEVDMSSQELIESRGYSIHGCVHSWTIHALNQTWDYDLAKLAIQLVGSHVPGEQTVQPWLTQRRLLQHAARCLYMLLNSLVTEDKILDNEIASACHNLGLLYAYQGKLAEAEQMCQRALQAYKKIWGLGHASALVIVNNLGNLYSKQGKLVEAEQMYQLALQGYKKIWGLEKVGTLDIVNNLGNLYKNQGKLVEAEQMYQRALQGYEKAWGPEHMLTLNTVNNLGTLYARQGKLAEAEQMYQQALQGYKKVLDLDNVITYIPALNTIINLGCLFECQADVAKAKAMYSKALIGYCKVFGPDHPKSQTLRDEISALDVLVENRALVGVEEPVDDMHGGPSHPGFKETTSKSKRQKLL